MCDFYKICFFNTLDIGMLKMRKSLQSKHKFKSILVFNNNFPFYEINPHYFGEYRYHIKSNITNFVTAGNFLKQKKILIFSLILQIN